MYLKSEVYEDLIVNRYCSYFFFFGGGRFAGFFLGFFLFFWATLGKKVAYLFLKYFFSFLHLYTLQQGRQVGKVGGW